IVVGKTPRELHEELTAKHENYQQLRAEHRQLIERHVQLDMQIRELAVAKGLSRKRFELDQVESQLSAMARRWRVLTIASQFLHRAKEAYERNRQPETLRAASEYLAQLTSGRYFRVWTKLGENVLLVDDVEGRSLPIEVLSHGMREQLFL